MEQHNAEEKFLLICLECTEEPAINHTTGCIKIAHIDNKHENTETAPEPLTVSLQWCHLYFYSNFGTCGPS